MKSATQECKVAGSLEGLVTEFYQPLLKYFRRKTRDTQAAEDLTHDVVVRLARYDKDEISVPAALVFTIAGNVLRDWQKSFSRKDSRKSELNEEVLADDISSERILEARDELRRVEAALEEMGDRTRSIFILFRIERMSQSEIARIFRISVSAVEKHVAKATVRLVRELQR